MHSSISVMFPAEGGNVTLTAVLLNGVARNVAVATFVRLVPSGRVAEYEHVAVPLAAIAPGIVAWLPAVPASQSTTSVATPETSSVTVTLAAEIGRASCRERVLHTVGA